MLVGRAALMIACVVPQATVLLMVPYDIQDDDLSVSQRPLCGARGHC